MSLATAIAIYFIIWWVVLFMVLPWGIRSQEEGGDVVSGSDPGAPAIPRLWWKLVWTTVVSGVSPRMVDLARSIRGVYTSLTATAWIFHSLRFKRLALNKYGASPSQERG